MRRNRPFAARRTRPIGRLPLLLLWLLSPLAASAAAQEPTPEPPVYVVQAGDTLFRIAQNFGTTVEAVAAANNLADPSLIQVGQKLLIPAPPPQVTPPPPQTGNIRVHPVRLGETLPFLAFRYGTTIWALSEANDLGRLGLLLPGCRLTIPPPTAPTASTPGFPRIAARPSPVLQGQTMVLEVQGDGALELSALLLEQALTFASEDGIYWALAGVEALTPPGGYALSLSAIEVESGDLITMHQTFSVTQGSFSTYNVVVPASRQGLLDPALARAERERVEAVYAGLSRVRLWDGVFGYPLNGELRTTAPFGQRRSYNGGPVSSYHTGLDYGADEGWAVSAPMTGTVALAEPLQVRGQAVILDHGWGVFTAFWHLSAIQVTPGQLVSKGQVVGLAGDTGLSTGPHLHWEMRVGGVPVDPLQWTQVVFP